MSTLNKKLDETLRAVRGLRALRQDDIEDYFHDAIVRVLTQEKSLDEWLGYIYKSVANRIACGQEGKVYLPLTEEIVPDEHSPNIDLKVDLERAFEKVSKKSKVYIYERYFEGRLLEEIAQRYGVTHQAVNRTIQQGLRKMRKVLKRG